MFVCIAYQHGSYFVVELLYVITVYSNTEGKGDWSDDGIKLHDEKTDQVVCLSVHLTSFVAIAKEPVSHGTLT